MSSSFPLGWEELNPVEWGNPLWRPQSGHDGDRGSNTSASHRDQDGGGGTGFRDRSAAVDGSSNKIHTIWQANSAPLKFNSHINMPISCETVSYRKVYSGLYTSSDLKKNNSLIAVQSDISSKVGSDGRSTKVSTWSSLTFVSRKKISSCGDTNSATTLVLALAYHQLWSWFCIFNNLYYIAF